MDWEFGISRCKLSYIEWVNNKVLLNSTGNYMQYPVINHNGKEYKKVYIYVLKTTQKINSFTTFKRMSAQSFPQQFSSKTPLHYSPGPCHEVHYPERSSTACLMEATFVVHSLEQMHPIYSSCNNDQLFSTRSGAAN